VTYYRELKKTVSRPTVPDSSSSQEDECKDWDTSSVNYNGVSDPHIPADQGPKLKNVPGLP